MHKSIRVLLNRNYLINLEFEFRLKIELRSVLIINLNKGTKKKSDLKVDKKKGIFLNPFSFAF